MFRGPYFIVNTHGDEQDHEVATSQEMCNEQSPTGLINESMVSLVSRRYMRGENRKESLS